MFATLTFVMISCLFADLTLKKGAAVVAYFKGEAKQVEAVVAVEVKKL